VLTAAELVPVRMRGSSSLMIRGNEIVEDLLALFQEKEPGELYIHESSG